MLVKERSLSTSLYIEALDYLNRLKKEDKFNTASLSVFDALYSAQASTLNNQGYFNSSNN